MLVAKLRALLKENQHSTEGHPQLKDESDESAKPEKRKGLDGKYRRTKKKKPKPPPGPPIKPPTPTGLNRYTPEEIGWPAEEIRKVLIWPSPPVCDHERLLVCHPDRFRFQTRFVFRFVS
jgi:hypothetical protein